MILNACRALAQDAVSETPRLIITGSIIPTAEEVAANPVQTLDRDYIVKSGERTAEQLLRDLPVANANGVPTSNNATGFAPGAASISLRGFDANATLVLIDGRRVAPYPVGTGGFGTQAFVDLNSIPAAAIENIEILKDGASTTYGADAVAGVVNIKLRHDYHGAEATIEYGNTLDKDNGEFRSSLLFGVGDGLTNISGVLSYYHRNAIFDRDRGFSNQAISLSSNSSPGNFQLSRVTVLAAGVPPSLLPQGDTFYAMPPPQTNGNASPNEYSYSPSRLATFDFAPFAGSFPESERYGGLINFDHRLLGDQLVIYAGVLYQNVRTTNELAPSPTGVFQSPGEIPLAIPPHAPGATLGGPTYEETGVPGGAFNPFNPFQQIISGGSRYRLAEFPNRVLIDTTESFLSTLGLKGDKFFDGSWGYDGALRYSEVRDTATGTFASRTRLNRILNGADPIFDPASPEFIGTTVPYNPFGDFHQPIASNTAGISFATVHPTDIQTSKLTTADFTLYTTSLFALPAGGVGLAIGGQFRREDIHQQPDQLEIEGDIAGVSGNATITQAGRKSFGIYGETNLPLFSAANSRPGFYSLELTGSARFEDYLDNNTNILVPKVGLRWQPWDETLTIRSTWGEGFREPSLFELHVSPQGFSQPLTDPLTGNFDSETPVLLKSNPNLAPEDSRNFTTGVVYSPKFVSSLTISVDLFDIERHDVVRPPDAAAILQREAQGKLLPGEEVLRDATGAISEVIGLYENNGGETARGIDFGLQYRVETSFGIFSSQTDATWLESFRRANAARAPALELRSQGAATGVGSDDAYLKWKGRSRFDWTWSGLDLNATVTYTDGFHEILAHDPSLPDGKKEHWVKQTWFVDAQASYQLSHLTSWRNALKDTTLTVGCNNVFGQDPPKAFFSIAGYADFIYDSVGRFVYVSLKKDF